MPLIPRHSKMDESHLQVRNLVISLMNAAKNAAVDRESDLEAARLAEQLPQVPPETLSIVLLAEFKRVALDQAQLDKQKLTLLIRLITEYGVLAQIKPSLVELLQNVQTPDFSKILMLNLLEHMGDDVTLLGQSVSFQNIESCIEQSYQLFNTGFQAMRNSLSDQMSFLTFLQDTPEEKQRELLTEMEPFFYPEIPERLLLPLLMTFPTVDHRKFLLQLLSRHCSDLGLAGLLIYAQSRLHPHIKEDYKKARLAQERAYQKRHREIKSTIQLDNVGRHPLIQESKLIQCYATIPQLLDGAQVLLVTRQCPDQTYLSASFLLNSHNGILEADGAEHLSETELREMNDDQEEPLRLIPVSGEYCRLRFEQAIKINIEQKHSVPIEFSVYQALLEDIDPQDSITLEALSERLKGVPDWAEYTADLFAIPDIANMWTVQQYFTLQPFFETFLKQTFSMLQQALSRKKGGFQSSKWLRIANSTAEELADQIVHSGCNSYLIEALTELLYLWAQPEQKDFLTLATIELKRLSSEKPTPVTPFVRQLARNSLILFFQEASLRMDRSLSLLWSSRVNDLKKEFQIKPRFSPVQF
jgi:hypothetical protein